MQNQNYLLELERELKYRNYSQKTIEVYTTCVKYFLKYINNNLSKINKETVIDFILHLKSKNKAPKTVNLYKEAIKFFTENILEEKINIDIKLSREAKKLPIILTKNEILKLIENISNLKHKLILKLAYGSGLKASEVIDLKVGDVNIDNLKIHIKNAKGKKVD